MSVRQFDGVDDRINLDNGIVGNDYDVAGWTLLCLVKPLAYGSYQSPFAIGGATDSASFGTPYVSSGGELSCGSDFPSYDGGSGISVALNTWQLIALTRASGLSATPRLHLATLGGSWSHADADAGAYASGSVAGLGGPRFIFGSFNNGGGPFNMRLAVCAFFPRGLSDANLAALGLSTYSIYTASGGAPSALWDLNQASTATAVTDLTGNGADQTSITGTSISSDDPPGWTFGIAAPSGGGLEMPVLMMVLDDDD